MQNLEDLFAYEGRKIWVQDVESGDFIPGNPFFVKDGCVTDSSRNIRDDIIGRLNRGKVSVSSAGFRMLDHDEKYFFFVYPTMRLNSRKFSQYGVDYMNILVGNVYRTESEAKDDQQRIKTVYDALARLEKPILTASIQDSELFLKRLAEANAEQDAIPPIDPEFPDETGNRGILKKIAETNQKEKIDAFLERG